jgi:hypothetical protein
MVLERTQLELLSDWLMDNARTEEELDEAEEVAMELVKHVLVSRTMALSRHMAAREAKAAEEAAEVRRKAARVKKEFAVHVPRYCRIVPSSRSGPPLLNP